MKRACRKPSKVSESLHQRLNSYALAASAAGVSLLALAQPAQAKVVYTPAHKRLPINNDFFLDLNHDGTNDLRFHILTSEEDCSAHRGTCESWDAADLFVYPQIKGDEVVGKAPYASALRAGASIGPQAGFNTSRGIMGAVALFLRSQPTYSGPWADAGKPVKSRYLGLKFIIKGKTHYGWARFNVRIYRNPESTVSAVLTGYAYETIPNKPIIAGKTHGNDVITPQPGASLGTLAVGANGLRAWR